MTLQRRRAPRPLPVRDPGEYQTTVTEVADQLNVSPATVRQWCTTRRIPAVRAGPQARWRIRNDWLSIFQARVTDDTRTVAP